MKKSVNYVRYIYLFLIDVAFVVALLFVNFAFDDKWAAPLATYADLFFLFGIPLYLLLRSILVRVFLKNPWWPNLMLLVEIAPGLPLLSGEFFKGDWEFVLGSLVVGTIVAAICVVCSLFTGAVMRLLSCLKSGRSK